MCPLFIVHYVGVKQADRMLHTYTPLTKCKVVNMMFSWTKSAQWIWTPKYRDEDTHTGRFFLFRKSFQWTAPASVREFPVHVSADSHYRLFVNGGRASFGPCKSYPERWHYETVDILPYLKKAEKVISARVLRYLSVEPGSSSIVRTELPELMVHGEVEGKITSVMKLRNNLFSIRQ